MDALPGTGIILLIGPVNAGKMGRVLEWWHTSLARRPIVVMPTGPGAQELTAEMAGRLEGLVGQAPAVTFDGLVRLVLGRSHRFVSDLERTVLVSRALRQVRTENLRRAGRLPGTAVAAARLLAELSESGRTEGEIDAILARWAVSDPAVASLADDLQTLTRQHREVCGRLGRTDRAEALREAVQVAGGWTRPVAFYGFTSFTPGQRALIEALSREAPVLLAFTYDRSRGLGLCAPEELACWEERAAAVVEASPRHEAYSSPAIAYLERFFMSDDRDRGPIPASSEEGGVRFLLASGRRAEAELAAEHIAALLRSGRRPGQIGVIVRNMESWRTLLGEVFESCGLPYQMDDRCLLGETGLGHAFLNALRGVVSDDPKSLLAYLRSPYSGVSVDDVSDLERRYLRGVGRGAHVLAEMARRGCGDALRPLWRLLAAEPASAGSDGHGSAPGKVAFVPAEAESQAACMLRAGVRGAASGGRSLEEDGRAYRALTGALAAMTAVAATDGAGPVGAGEALALLAQAPVPAGHAEMYDAVHVLVVHRARARRFEVVFVLGLVEGEFPGRADPPSLLSPTQRTRLNLVGGGLFAPEIDQESALFVSAVSRARTWLYLSARDTEDDGSDATRSRFWDSAKSLLGLGDEDHERRTLADQVFLPAAAPSPRHYRRACAALGVMPRPASGAAGALEPPPPARAWRRAPRRLTHPAVLEELGSEDCFSPSALERYAECPFAWFVERVVKLEEIDLGLDGRMMGLLLHSVLSATFQELARRELLPVRPDRLAEAEQIVAEAVDAAVDGEDCPGTPAERRAAGWRLRRMAGDVLAREAGEDGVLGFQEAEAVVGGWRGVDIGGLRIRGRIDRIDGVPGGTELFVVDYKTGAIPRKNKIGTAEGLQLPLYMAALESERPDARVLGGVYLSAGSLKRSGVVREGSEELLGVRTAGLRTLGDEEAAELFHSTREVAMQAAAGIQAGLIEPRAGRQCPEWCGLGPLCRSRSWGFKP